MSRSISRLQSGPFLDNGIETGKKHFPKTLSYTALGSWWALTAVPAFLSVTNSHF